MQIGIMVYTKLYTNAFASYRMLKCFMREEKVNILRRRVQGIKADI